MKPSKSLLYLSLICSIHLINSLEANCQIASRNSKQNTFFPKFSPVKPSKEYSLKKEDIRELLRQDSIESLLGYPYRFGKAIDVDIDLVKEGEQRKSGDTTFHYLSIKSSEAFSLNLIFDKLFLNNKSFINIYNSDNSMIYGPIKSNNISKNGGLWTDLIRGNQICIELVSLRGSKSNLVHISKVIHGYRNTFTPNLYGDALPCNIDIACPAGSTWRKEADAVAMVLLDVATRWCSGALLNNTARDFKGYFLTAFHCLDMNNDGSLSSSEKSDVNNWLFRFKYESPTCGGSDGTSYVTFNGSYFRSAYAQTDMTLLELYNSPSILDCITYAGWSKSPTPASSGTGIHHPAGDVKKISFDNNTLTSNSSVIHWTNGLQSPINSHWVVGFDNGTTQGGSSGSPLFNQNHQITGQLHGGANGCAPVTKYYGRFDMSWSGGGTNDTRLSNWLDPLNAGTVSMKTEIPAYISGPPQFCTTETYTIPNLPTGTTVTWGATGSVSIFGANNVNPVMVTKNTDGIGTLSATINTACGNIVVSKQLYGGVLKAATQIFINGISYNKNSNLCLPRISQYVVSVAPVDGATSYYWSIGAPGAVTLDYGQGTNTIGITVFGSPGSSLSFAVQAENSCGRGAGFDIMGKVCGLGNEPIEIIVYPNPSNGELRIGYITEDLGIKDNNKVVARNGFSVKLLNEKDRILKRGKTTANNKEIVLQVADLPNGIYYLHIYEGKNVSKQQVVIAH